MNNLLSFSSVKLDRFSKDGVGLSPASGFILETGNQHYLITNWHVVSGEDIYTAGQREPLKKPYVLKTSVHIHGGAEGKTAPLSMGMRKKITIQLYDDNDSPRWIEWRTNTENKFTAIPISAIDTDVEYGPPDAVHIIGYPLGWEPDGSDRTSSAFWRTSFIASEIYEPGMHRTDTFFIDPCAPEGMTGSPVIGVKNDRMKLLGVYSELSTAEFGASAGLVYVARLVKELIRDS